MHKIHVLDAATLGEDLDLSPLREFGEVTVFDGTKPEETAAHTEGAEIAVINKVKMNRETLRGVSTLRLIVIAATGYDNVDLTYCREAGIGVCNVVGYSTQSVTQLTVAMVLSLSTHLPAFTGAVADGTYSRGTVANILTPVYHEVSGKTWGIVGYGHIGGQVAAVARALGCCVLACKRTPSPDANCVGIDTLCRKADIISIHTPLNDETRNLIHRERIAMMKKGTVLVNVARGAVCDESAVTEAVLSGHLGGFGCDVYSREPFPENHPFAAIRALPNVCLTPHMAWGSYEARARCLADMAESIRSYVAGGQRNRLA